jgi:hypothetical protein
MDNGDVIAAVWLGYVAFRNKECRELYICCVSIFSKTISIVLVDKDEIVRAEQNPNIIVLNK